MDNDYVLQPLDELVSEQLAPVERQVERERMPLDSYGIAHYVLLPLSLSYAAFKICDLAISNYDALRGIIEALR